MGELLQHLINGVSLGTIYALMALGYTMVYGVLRLINFAHADVFMVGAYFGLFSAKAMGADKEPSLVKAALVLVASAVGSALLGLVIERLAYRPLRARPRLTALITAIGVSFLLENGAQLIWSPDPRRFPRLLESETYMLGEAGVNIATFALGRDAPGGSAIALVEIDGAAPVHVLQGIQRLPGVKQARALTF